MSAEQSPTAMTDELSIKYIACLPMLCRFCEDDFFFFIGGGGQQGYYEGDFKPLTCHPVHKL